MFEYLISFLLFFLLFLIILSLIFYNVIKTREYFFTSTTQGTALTYDTTPDNFHKLKQDGNVLEFLPFYEDRKRRIRGNLVLTTYSTNTETQYFKIRVMNGSDRLSEGIYEIKPNMDYNYINFKVDAKENRKLTIDIQKYNKTTQTADTTLPTGLNIVKASGYYY